MKTKGKKVELTEEKLVGIIEKITNTAVKEAKAVWDKEHKAKLAEMKQPKITSKQIDTLIENKVNAILSKKFNK